MALTYVAGVPAAIAAVPAAAAVVIVIVTTLVTDIRLVTACTTVGAACFLLRWVSAFALRTVLKLPLIARCSTAVAIIPVAPAIIVQVVTSVITLPI